MFNSLCSIYENAKDNLGRYADRETGECITDMTIYDFCLTDRWRENVEKLRALRAAYGDEAKKMEEYRQTKELLPGATLSGLFEAREVVDEKTGRTALKSRLTSHLKQHTGFLCIDVDSQDNMDMRSVFQILRRRPEVALLMKSCSGTGYFALIPLAFPERHKEQFAALISEYAGLGIRLDRQCGDVTRVRFASYDENPYINEGAVAYSRMSDAPLYAPSFCLPKFGGREQGEGSDIINKVERLVRKLETLHIDITNEYYEWLRVGFSLANLPEPWGRHFFHRVSALSEKYNQAQCEKKFREVSRPSSITIGSFFSICRDYGVLFKD